MTVKVKFIALLEAAKVSGKEANLDALAKELDTDVSILKTWQTKHDKECQSQAVRELIASDEPVVITDEPLSDESGHHVELIDGKITVVDKRIAKEVELKNAKVERFKQGVTGLQLLNEDLQSTAGKLVGHISDLANDPLHPRDLASLTSALCSVQQAFFNKPVTNVQVNTMSSDGASLLTKFKNRMKS